MSYITDINQLDPDGTYTYADYLQWRFEEYVELFRGKIMRMSPAPLRRHQDVVGNIYTSLNQYLKKKTCRVYMAPFDVRLPKKRESNDRAIYTVVQPDICIICDPSKLDERGCIGAPDLIVEVLSRGNLGRDLTEKFELYQEHGVSEYWIASPGEQTIVTYYLEDGKYRLTGNYGEPAPIPVQVLPGCSIEWVEIFET